MLRPIHDIVLFWISCLSFFFKCDLHNFYYFLCCYYLHTHPYPHNMHSMKCHQNVTFFEIIWIKIMQINKWIITHTFGVESNAIHLYIDSFSIQKKKIIIKKNYHNTNNNNGTKFKIKLFLFQFKLFTLVEFVLANVLCLFV